MSRKIDRGKILNAMKIVDNPKKSLQAVTWDGTQVKAVFREKERTLQDNIGKQVKRNMENLVVIGDHQFGPDKKNIIPFSSLFSQEGQIRKNFAVLFSDDTFEQLRPEIANVLSDKQKKNIIQSLGSVSDKCNRIWQLSKTRDTASFNAINNLINQITEVSKLCRDVYESALSSESLIERKKHDALRGSETFAEVEETLKRDLIMAFKQMGWDITSALEKTKLEDIQKELPENASEEVGGVSPFEQKDVATFILNYNQLSPEQKRTFSIPRLFEVYEDTAKNKIESRFRNDETAKHQSLELLKSDVDKNFSREGWKATQLSGDGSLMRYSREIMDFIHSADIAREERKTLGNANIDSVRLAGVPKLALVLDDLQDENELEGLRQEIKQPFLDAIANETIDNGFKVKKDSGIVRNFMTLLATEKFGISGGYVSDITEPTYFKKLCEEVYKYMTEHHMAIDGRIVSQEMFIKLQEDSMTLDNLTPTPTPPTGAPTTAFKLDKDKLKEIIKVAENIELLEAFLSIEDNKDYVKNHESLVLDGLDDTAKADLKEEITAEKWPLYCAAAGLITDASKKKAGKSIEEVWESAKEDIGKACESEAVGDLFVEKKDVFTLNNVYRVGVFNELVKFITDKVGKMTFEGDEDTKMRKKSEAIKNFVQAAMGNSLNEYETEFFQNVALCVANGGKVEGNQFYGKLLKEAQKEIIISRYSKHISDLKAKDAADLTEEEKKQVKAWDEELNRDGKGINLGNLLTQAEKIIKEPSEEEVLKESKNKEAIKISSLGDKKEFDVQGFTKKLKPFNVKAGQKYLDGLIKAIKNVTILESTVDPRGSEKPGQGATPENPSTGDNENGGAGSGNGGNGSTNPNYTPEELKEKAAFYIMGHALDQSLNDMIRAGGLTEEDKNRLLSEQQDMKNLFNLLAFGEDKDKKFTFNNGKNAIQCGKIGYIQQIIYSKATDPNFKMNADELALVLADGQDVAIGARQERETDDMYIARIKANPTIASIIRSLDSISSEVAYALVGITSTKDGKDGHFAGKIDEKIMEALKDAKTPDEIKKALDSLNTTSFDMSTHKTTEGPIAKIIRDSQLDFAVAKSREELRERIKDYAKKNIIDFSADKQTQKRQVQQFLNSEKVNEVQGMIYDTTIESNATARKEILDRVANELYSEIDNGLIANNEQTDISIHLAKNVTPVVPAVPTVPTVPTTPNYDAIVDKLIENKFDLSVLSLPNADALKQQKRAKLRNEFSINANQYQGLLPESLTEDILNIIIDKFEERTREQQDNKTSIIIEGEAREILKENVEILKDNGQLEYTESGRELIINVINSTSPELAEKLSGISIEDFVKLIKELEAEIIKEKPEVKLDEPLEETFEEEIKFKPLTIDDIKFDKFLFYGTDVNNNDYMQVILHAINYVREHNGDYENFKQQILGNAKLAKDDLKTIINDPDFQSDIEKYLPVKSAENPKDNSAYQQIVEELAKAGFKLDPEGNYTTQVAEKLLELAKSNPLFNRQFTNDEIQGIVEAYSEYQRNHPAENVNKVQVVLDALKENGFEVDFTMGMPQKQIGEELKNPKYDKIRDVIKSLTEEEAKTITSEWIELYAKQGNADMSY